ncbi:MAG: hypothetical protein KatS3mg001_060 [Candidatus Pacearchaeota archaeon]|nr:MAG: hypothetical protein KatS3mg001_060 [Candidatus Pacearchaeota archaeon]
MSKMYKKEDIEINGTTYKRIIKVVSGSFIWQKDVPLTSEEIHASGCHLIFNNSKQNHFDHIKAGSEWKEYINQEVEEK